MQRVLIADVPEVVTVLRAALADDITVVAASDVEEALQRARRGIDLIITGIHFADSQMLDFVQAVKADPSLRDLPVVCVRLIGAERAPALLSRLQQVLDVLGNVEYVDLNGLIGGIGREPALREFAKRIRTRLAAGRYLPGQWH